MAETDLLFFPMPDARPVLGGMALLLVTHSSAGELDSAAGVAADSAVAVGLTILITWTSPF